MPPRRPSRQQPAPHRTRLWVGIAVAILMLAGVASYFWTSRAPEPAPEVETTPAPTAPALTAKHIYSETADPSAEIEAALIQAKAAGKRVILDFGGDWCGDCQVLDIYFHQGQNAELLEKNFVLVHVWIGHMDRNIDLAAKYGVPISKGVPALAVLRPNGKAVYAQATGEFNDMRHMDVSSVTEFLKKWKS